METYSYSNSSTKQRLSKIPLHILFNSSYHILLLYSYFVDGLIIEVFVNKTNITSATSDANINRMVSLSLQPTDIENMDDYWSSSYYANVSMLSSTPVLK